MALYICLRVEAGKMNYNKIFGYRLYKQFQSEVDAMLAADGYEIDSDGWAVKKDAEVTSSAEITA